ncbi:MAG: hypothetical protein U0Q14_00480 [Dermatophilaceae bacterium]
MGGAGLAAVRILDPDRRVWKAAQIAASTGDRLGVESWVGDLLATCVSTLAGMPWARSASPYAAQTTV